MRVKEKLEGTEEILRRIKEKNKSAPIIVEGKKDVRALRKLGVKGKIIKIKSYRTIFHIIESLRGKYTEVIILTDWDSAGSNLYYKVKKACKANGLSFNERLRRQLIKYTKTEIKDIESLPTFLERLRVILKNPYKARNKQFNRK